MEVSDFSSPFFLIALLLLILVALIFWNKYNAKVQRKRRSRSFRSNYFEKKKHSKDENLH